MFIPALIVTAALATFPSLNIISPIPNQNIVSDKVTVGLSVPNFKLTDYKTYVKPTYGQGHIHLWLDQTTPTKASAIKITAPTYTFENVKPGNHILVAELVANDHSSLNPKMVTSVSFKTSLPVSPSNSSNIVIMSVMAFLLVTLALYFISIPKTYKSPKKSSPKSPKKPSRK